MPSGIRRGICGLVVAAAGILGLTSSRVSSDEVSGGQVERSILSARVRVNSYAQVSDSILFEGVDIGRHARTTIGVPSLPGDAAVEVEGMFEIA